MNHATRDQHSGFRAWLDRRTGLDSLLRHALDEPIPGGAKIAYVFGSGLLFLFLSQIEAFTHTDQSQSSSCSCFTSLRPFFTARIKDVASWCGWRDALCSS